MGETGLTTSAQVPGAIAKRKKEPKFPLWIIIGTGIPYYVAAASLAVIEPPATVAIATIAAMGIIRTRILAENI